MGKAKDWNVDDIDSIAMYLNSTAGLVILKLRNRKGGRKFGTSMNEEVATSISELAKSFNAGDDQDTINVKFEDWCSLYLIEGGRNKLLSALTSKKHRAKSVDDHVTPAPKSAPQSKELETADSAVAKLLQRFTKAQILLALEKH
jgi:hypothetical protein